MKNEMTIKPRFDRFPLPWPPKPLVLKLLGLDPKTATQEQYHARWYERAADLLGQPTALEQFTQAVDNAVANYGLSWTDAWYRAQRTHKSLWLAVKFQEEVRQARGIPADDWRDIRLPEDLAQAEREFNQPSKPATEEAPAGGDAS